MKLVLYGINHHDCPVAMREKISFTQQQRHLMLKKMHTEPDIGEAVILETCNRVEFYFYVRKNFDIAMFLSELIGQFHPEAIEIWHKYSATTEAFDTVRHLFEVAAGLDSQMIGENQILSQVKAAYALSLECRMSKLIFHRLFHNAFRVGKAVRSDTDINCGAVSVGLAAVELARGRMDLACATAMIIGAGENAQLLARYLLKGSLKKLIVANRDTEKAKALCSALNCGSVISLSDIPARLDETDILIASTASTEPIVTAGTAKEILARRKKKLLAIDLAVPRDIDPALGDIECVCLYNIDDLNENINFNRKKRSSEIPKARRIIDDFTAKFAQWYESLNLVPVISELTKRAIELAHAEAGRYAKDFDPANKKKLELFAESLVKKVLHGPISFIKAGSDAELSSEQLQAVDIINKMFLQQDKRN